MSNHNNVLDIANQSADKYGIDRAAFQALLISESGSIYGSDLSKQVPNDTVYAANPGHIGYGQLSWDLINKYGISDPYDPAQNIDGAAKYFSSLMAATGGDFVKSVSIYKGLSGATPERAQVLLDRYGAIYADTKKKMAGDAGPLGGTIPDVTGASVPITAGGWESFKSSVSDILDSLGGVNPDFTKQLNHNISKIWNQGAGAIAPIDENLKPVRDTGPVTFLSWAKNLSVESVYIIIIMLLLAIPVFSKLVKE